MDHPYTVLVARAGQAGQQLTERLGADGWQAIHCPPVSLSAAADPVECLRLIEGQLPVERIILTSPEGVRQTARLVEPARFGAAIVVTPGPATAELARSLGFAVVVSPRQSGDSEAMLALPELDRVAGSRVLILAAAGGRRLLEQELRQRGALVKRVHVYQRIRCALPDGLEQALTSQTIVISLVSSGGALEAWRESLSESAWQRLLAGLMIVPSKRVAAMARAMGAGRVRCAAGADDQAMIDALNEATSGGQFG